MGTHKIYVSSFKNELNKLQNLEKIALRVVSYEI